MFNYGQYLEACIHSVLSQEGVDIDLLILDDASTDDSLSIAEKISGEDARVRVIAHTHNRGHIPTVNEGMAAAGSEYVVKLDADDMLTEGSLRRSAGLLEAFPAVGFVYGLPRVIGAGDPPPVRTKARSWTIWPGQAWLETRARRPHNPIMQPEVVIRQSALRAAGPYRAELPHTSDFEMWLRLAARSDVGRINGAYQGFKREHPASMSRTVNAGLLRDITERTRAVDSFLADCSPLLPDARRLANQAHRALSREALGHALSAYARGTADTEPVGGYAALAGELWPGAAATAEGQLVSRLRSGKNAPMRLAAREARRDVQARLLWRYWKWSGT